QDAGPDAEARARLQEASHHAQLDHDGEGRGGAFGLIRRRGLCRAAVGGLGSAICLTPHGATLATARKFRKPDRSAAPAALATGSNAPNRADLSLEASIGRKVRNLRQRLQLTASEVAAEAGVSTGMLSKIENGGTSASL